MRAKTKNEFERREMRIDEHFDSKLLRTTGKVGRCQDLWSFKLKYLKLLFFIYCPLFFLVFFCLFDTNSFSNFSFYYGTFF